MENKTEEEIMGTRMSDILKKYCKDTIKINNEQTNLYRMVDIPDFSIEIS